MIWRDDPHSKLSNSPVYLSHQKTHLSIGSLNQIELDQYKVPNNRTDPFLIQQITFTEDNEHLNLNKFQIINDKNNIKQNDKSY